MGLLDVFRGMMNGPRGQAAPSSGGGGMSPLTMGLLALLAYKAFKGGGLFGQNPPPPNSPTGRNMGPTNAGPANAPNVPYGGDGGGLSDWLRGTLGGAVAGGAAGSIVSGGLTELLQRLQQNGQGEVGRSWIGAGPNEPITPGALEKAAGADTLDALARESGISRDQVLHQLSEELPQTVDTLSPDGRIPTEEEASRWA